MNTQPVLEGEEIEVFAFGHEWKWMSDAVERFRELARELKVTPLDNFVSFTREDQEYFFGGDTEHMEAEAELRDGTFYLDGQRLWDVERTWHTPESGLETAQTLLGYLQNHSEYWTNEDRQLDYHTGLPYILGAFAEVMEDARSQNKQFYLALTG